MDPGAFQTKVSPEVPPYGPYLPEPLKVSKTSHFAEARGHTLVGHERQLRHRASTTDTFDRCDELIGRKDYLIDIAPRSPSLYRRTSDPGIVYLITIISKIHPKERANLPLAR